MRANVAAPPSPGWDADPKADKDTHQHKEKSLLTLARERQDFYQAAIKGVDILHGLLRAIFSAASLRS